MGESRKRLWGLLAEFPTPDALTAAASAVREAGYRKWDAHTPFPVHGLDGAMGVRRTKLPWLVFGAGLTGCLGGLLLQWYTNAFDYKIIISGKPFWSVPASIPVAFELTILLAALTAFFAMMVLNGLPQLHHPVFRSERFRRATNDRFFISLEATDPIFDVEKAEALLREAGSVHVEWIEDED
jgi:hypothetical protein